MNLYKFSHPDTDETILLVTPQPRSERELRGEMGDYDHGGIDWDVFALLVDSGTITEVYSLKECGKGWKSDNIPFGYVDAEGTYTILREIFKKLKPPANDEEHRLAQVQSLFAEATPVVAHAVQYAAFNGSKFIEDEKGHAILEVIWGSFDDQHFYAQAYQNMKFLLEYIEKIKK
jgi:hypothetical protein